MQKWSGVRKRREGILNFLYEESGHQPGNLKGPMARVMDLYVLLWRWAS